VLLGADCNDATIEPQVEKSKGHIGMGRRRARPDFLSRRQFLRQLGYASPAIFPAPFRLRAWPVGFHGNATAYAALPEHALAEFRLRPDYPSPSPLDEMLRLVVPGTDGYVTEKYAAQLHRELAALRSMVMSTQGAQAGGLVQLLHEAFAATDLSPAQEQRKRSDRPIELGRVSFIKEGPPVTRNAFAEQLAGYFATLGRVEIVEFEIVGLETKDTAPLELEVEVRYTLVGVQAGGGREQRIGTWQMSWRQASEAKWLATRWTFLEESRANSPAALYEDVTLAALGKIESYEKQLTYGVDHWRRVLDGACGIDIYGNNGIAAGDFDGDGRVDIMPVSLRGCRTGFIAIEETERSKT
jgi:hypothetical protein